jgi:hypothetical protein
MTKEESRGRLDNMTTLRNWKLDLLLLFMEHQNVDRFHGFRVLFRVTWNAFVALLHYSTIKDRTNLLAQLCVDTRYVASHVSPRWRRDILPLLVHNCKFAQPFSNDFVRQKHKCRIGNCFHQMDAHTRV